MPILKKNGESVVPSISLSLIERIKVGRVVPIISDEAMFDLVLNGYQTFTQKYADYTQYPLPDKDNLVKVTKFFKLTQQANRKFTDEDLKTDYLNYVKNYVYERAGVDGTNDDLIAEAAEQIDNLSVSAFANLLGYPRLDKDRADPLLVLANLPFKTILTTSPYTFIEDALRKGQKKPRTEICCWHKGLVTIDPVIDATYKPSVSEPLVYHLHGLDQYPDSLVLTEDDYLEFLVNVCQGQGNNAADRIHALVRKVLSDDLILLGFSLNSWAFRVLYAGLIKPNGKFDDRGVCCLQLASRKEENTYLEDYAQREAKFEVFWGDLYQYAQYLGQL